MLFTKKIEDITFQDVVAFCQNNTLEGFVLDYKSDFPKNNDDFAKTIAAFANTYGGLLILGVNAPQGLPLPPFEGMPFDPKLKYTEKIENIILSNIYEPIIPLPEVQVCTPVNNKTFIVIRVQESEHTPHRTGNDKDIYIRTGQSSSPHKEERATYEKIEWLASRRKKSIELREHLLGEGETYCIEALKNKGVETVENFAVLTLKIVPLFPHNALFNFGNIVSIINKCKIYTNNNPDYVFPTFDLDIIHPIQNGFHEIGIPDLKTTKEGQCFHYLNVNSFGLYLHKQDIKHPPETRKKEREDINYFRILRLVQCFLHSAHKFYSEIPYWGALFFKVELSNILGLEIKHPGLSYGYNYSRSDNNLSKVSRSYLEWKKNFTTKVLGQNLNQIISGLMTDIAWSLGLGVDDKILQKALSQYITQ